MSQENETPKQKADKDQAADLEREHIGEKVDNFGKELEALIKKYEIPTVAILAYQYKIKVPGRSDTEIFLLGTADMKEYANDLIDTKEKVQKAAHRRRMLQSTIQKNHRGRR